MNNYKSVNIYKPTKSIKGGALQLKPSIDPTTKVIDALYIEASKQVGDKTFDWNTKVVMKLGVPDISKIMTVFSGREPNCKLFHKSQAGSSTLDLAPNANMPGYYVRIGSSASNMNVGVSISNDEAELLLALLRGIVPRIYGWC